MPNATETEAADVEKGTLAEGRAKTDASGSGPSHVPPSVPKAYLEKQLAPEG